MTETLAGISPYLKLKVSNRARRIALRLDSGSRHVNLVVPARYNIKKAEQFALEHKDWILDKLAGLPQPILFEHDAIIPIMGQDRRLDISYDTTSRSTSIILNENEVLIRTNKDDPTPRLIRFLKQEVKEALTALALEKAAGINRKIRSVQVRDTKTRWGSCAPDGRLSFSWRLVFAPQETLDYLVAHEVAHLVHMNHGKRFWALCEKLSADYHGGKEWIRKNGQELMRYGSNS